MYFGFESTVLFIDESSDLNAVEAMKKFTETSSNFFTCVGSLVWIIFHFKRGKLVLYSNTMAESHWPRNHYDNIELTE
jgi:hypothetical protein